MIVAVIAGGDRDAACRASRFAAALSAIRRMASTTARRDQALCSAVLREVRVLGQEAVAGVNGVGLQCPGVRDDRPLIQIASNGRGGSDADGLAREADVEWSAIRLGIHRDGLNLRFAAWP